MIVDDVLSMMTMLQEYLIIQGATVMPFDAPLQALAAFEKNPDAIDLVITDETMPDLSGMDLAKEMLTIRPNLPIILCTGYSLHATPESVSASGIAAFFQKPVKMRDLLQKANALLAERDHEHKSD